MSEEVKDLELEETVDSPELETINELLAKMDKMVDKEQYDKLLKEKKALLHRLVNERPAPIEEPKVIRKTAEIAKEFQSIEHGSVSNRAYIQKALEYREAHIAEFGTDPFTDFGAGGPSAPTDQTKKVADGLQNLLNQYKSDSLFNSQLQEFLKDDLQLLRKLASSKK